MIDDTSRLDLQDDRRDRNEADADKAGTKHPPAGPHSKPELTDEEKTPGAGTLPDVNEDDVGDAASS